MNQSLRKSSAASLIVAGSLIAGCAAQHAHLGAASHFNSKPVELGFATRALAAFNSNNIPLAIDLAEKAAAKSPTDAAVRTLLGNAYFAAGRFVSAEAAYRDSLTIDGNQSRVILKLALVEIAQGKDNRAVAMLNGSTNVLDASDYGLALALAGRSAEAVAVLEPAARQPGADATVRQNLALAQALAGNWEEARVVASQDVPADQLEARIQQWMRLSKPQHAADQVAAVVGITPALVDPGQPVQLALNKGDPQVRPAAKTAPVELAAMPVAPKAVPAPPAMPVSQPPVPAFAEVSTPRVVPVPAALVSPKVPVAQPLIATLAASAASEARTVLEKLMPRRSEPMPVRAKVRAVPAVRAVATADKSHAVVQLGAYGSADRVLAAWTGASHRFGALKAYAPMSARFASPKGTFYRLSVRGFGSVTEAKSLCSSLHRAGAACFVRNVAGDAPVNIAAR